MPISSFASDDDCPKQNVRPPPDPPPPTARLLPPNPPPFANILGHSLCYPFPSNYLSIASSSTLSSPLNIRAHISALASHPPRSLSQCSVAVCVMQDTSHVRLPLSPLPLSAFPFFSSSYFWPLQSSDDHIIPSPPHSFLHQPSIPFPLPPCSLSPLTRLSSPRSTSPHTFLHVLFATLTASTTPSIPPSSPSR